MTVQQQYIELLKKMVIAKLGQDVTTSEGCRVLGDAIAKECGVEVSTASLERIFVESRQMGTPQPATLSTLSKYLGYSSWSEFYTTHDITTNKDTYIIPTRRRWGVVVLTIIALVIVGIVAFVMMRGNILFGDDENKAPKSEQYSTEQCIEDVKEEWIAKTTEQCNALRAYLDEDSDTAQQRIADEKELFLSTLEESIRQDILLYAEQHHISLSEDSVAEHSATIATICRQMCQTL